MPTSDINHDSGFTIIIDTREQTPWVFTDCSTQVATLPTADYSVQGYEDQIAIERKTLNDLVKTITRDRERFVAELKRLSEIELRAIVIESTVEDVINARYTSDVTPGNILGTVLTFEVGFRIPFHFWCSRQIAEWMAQKWLQKAYRLLEKRETRQANPSVAPIL